MSSLNRLMQTLAWGALALGVGVYAPACDHQTQAQQAQHANDANDANDAKDAKDANDANVTTPSARPQPKLVSSQRTGRLRRYPCSDCHRMISAAEPTSAYAAGHADLQFEHFAAIQQCELCHDAGDMNHLRLLDGTLTSFDDAQNVCGQCHGEKLRDFLIGAHGKVMGNARVKYRYVCTDCHDPHSPRPERVTALPAPPFPELGIPKRHPHE